MLQATRPAPSRNHRDTFRCGRPLILVNGLAEQSISWYRNRDAWQRRFDVHLPGVLVYDGPVIQEHLRQGGAITVDFLARRLADYLDNFVQSPPYHLVGSSLGGQIVIEYAARHPERVDRLVLLCPSGMGSEERLPVMEGARHKNYQGLVESTFFDRTRASPGVIKYYEDKFAFKAWRKAVFETIRGTKSHSVRDKLPLINRPTLVICGREDRIVDSKTVREAIEGLPQFTFVSVPRCGHAPQLERPRVVNRLVADFLEISAGAPPDASPEVVGASDRYGQD